MTSVKGVKCRGSKEDALLNFVHVLKPYNVAFASNLAYNLLIPFINPELLDLCFFLAGRRCTSLQGKVEFLFLGSVFFFFFSH